MKPISRNLEPRVHLFLGQRLVAEINSGVIEKKRFVFAHFSRKLNEVETSEPFYFALSILNAKFGFLGVFPPCFRCHRSPRLNNFLKKVL